jgi:hypothetical protein
MKSFNISISLLICFSSLVLSCSPRLYFPDRAATTSFSEKNQFLVNGSIKPQTVVYSKNGVDSFRSKGASYSVDAAYALTNHWAISGYYSNVIDRATSESFWKNSASLYNGRRYELSVTYFDNPTKHSVLEFSAGYSNGRISRQGIFSSYENFKTNYNIYYGQVACGYKSNYFNFSVGSRIWLQHYYQFRADSNNVRQYFHSKSTPEKDVTQYPFLFASLFYNFEYGYKFLKFNTQIGTPFQLSGPAISGWPIYMTFGVVFRFEKDFFNEFKKK